MYSIELTKKSKQFLKKLPLEEQTIILRKLWSIREQPHPHLKKLTGSRLWRLRIGKYRAIIDIIIKGKNIIVLRIGKRDKIYFN